MALSRNSDVIHPWLGWLDQLLGLRSWGLILYGALPASLSLLGILDVKLGTVSKLLPVLLVSLLPLSLTFMLIKARQRDWYFTTDYLNLRSSITTFLIVVSATLIAGASGIIRDKYVFSLHNLTDRGHMLAMGESFLFGMASLVVSSTLFAAILTKDANLPGLPSADFVKSAAGVRQKLIAIQRSTIWKQYDPATGTEILDELAEAARTLGKELSTAVSYPGHRLAIRAMSPIDPDLNDFRASMIWIKAGDDVKTKLFRWQVIFAEFVSNDDKSFENVRNERGSKDASARYAAAQRLKILRLGGSDG